MLTPPPRQPQINLPLWRFALFIKSRQGRFAGRLIFVINKGNPENPNLNDFIKKVKERPMSHPFSKMFIGATVIIQLSKSQKGMGSLS